MRFLEDAKKAGGKNAKLIVVIARDSTVEKTKGRKPIMSEDQRCALVKSLRVVDEAVLGYEGLEIDEVIEKIKHAAEHISLVKEITEVRARWIGHFIHAEVNVAVSPSLSVEQGHDVAREVKNQVKKHIGFISNVVVHVDPLNASGEHHH